MADAGFAPFVPRCLGEPVLAPSLESVSVEDPSPRLEAAHDEAVAKRGDGAAPGPNETAMSRDSGTDAQPSAEAQQEPAQVAATSEVPAHGHDFQIPSRAMCDHSIQIRNEAIRLASIACGRALRHAVVLHPAVIVAFVDEALAVAGPQRKRRVLVHPDLVEALGEQLPVAGDPTLIRGDLRIEADGCGVDGLMDQRAALLVAAAAQT